MSTTTTTATTNETTTTPDPLDRLAPHHLEQLRESGLRDDTIRLAGFRTVRDKAVADILGYQPKDFNWGTGWTIDFPSRNGHKKPYGQVKLDFPRIGDDGKQLKYESPKNQEPRCYFSPDFDKHAVSAKVIVITEGVKKCLAIWQAGYPCVALTGVWNWQRKRLRDDNNKKAFGKRELLKDLAELDWNGREVVIVFDSDAAEKPEVKAAEAKLAEALTACGATVRVARIPMGGEDKVGADDFLVKHGGDSFAKIIDAAGEPEMPTAESRLGQARQYVDEFFRTPEGLTYRWHRDEHFVYQDGRYILVPQSELEALAYPWLDARIHRCKPHHVGELVKSFRSVDGARVPFNIERPCWLNDGTADATNIVAFRNGLVNIGDTGGQLETWDHTPAFFSTVRLPYDFDPKATCPRWNAWLQDIFNGDAECIDLLQCWSGYLLTGDTRYQKILCCLGQKRSGKGTWIRAMMHVLGEDACCSPSLTSLVSDFGLAQLLDRTACFFPDAHLGRNTAPQVLDVLKSVSGEDRVSVNRKYLPALPAVRLRVRFTLSVNQLPRLHDASGALASRLLILRFPNCYLNREDLSLEATFRGEAAGVLNWCLQGLHRLRERGRFILPQASEELAASYERLTSPVTGFIEDRCELRPDGQTPTQRLYDEWRLWCDEHGHEPGSESVFGTSLYAAAAAVDRTRKRDNGKLTYFYTGISLSDGGN